MSHSILDEALFANRYLDHAIELQPLRAHVLPQDDEVKAAANLLQAGGTGSPGSSPANLRFHNTR